MMSYYDTSPWFILGLMIHSPGPRGFSVILDMLPVSLKNTLAKEQAYKIRW